MAPPYRNASKHLVQVQWRVGGVGVRRTETYMYILRTGGDVEEEWEDQISAVMTERSLYRPSSLMTFCMAFWPGWTDGGERRQVGGGGVNRASRNIGRVACLGRLLRDRSGTRPVYRIVRQYGSVPDHSL